MTLADKYHDEHGRPIVPEPSQTSSGTLEAWQRSTLARATARQEARADAHELGPLHAQPSKEKTKRHATLGAALGAPPPPVAAALGGAEPDDPDEIRAAINQAFALPPPRPAGEPEQPAAAESPRWSAIGEHRHNELVAAHDRACAGADRAEAQQAVKETLAKYATPTPADPPVRMSDAEIKALAEAEKSANRREGARKAAATVRARREQREHETAVNELMEKSLDRIGERVIREEKSAALEATILAADPGILTPTRLLALARDNNAEADLYRIAHLARVPRQPAQWPAEFRRVATDEINRIVSTRNAKTQKGPKK